MTDHFACIVEDKRLVAVNGHTNVHRDSRVHATAHHCHRAFGWSVAILKPHMLAPQVREVLRQCLATHVQKPQVGQLAGRMLNTHRTQEGWWWTEHIDPLRAHPRDKVRPGSNAFVIHWYKRCTNRQRHPCFFDT